jgi:hypothetical protein
MTATSYLVFVYAVYGLVSVTLTIWLARALFKNGAVFLESVFADNPNLAEALNRLLVIGFYLLNLGYACMIMKASGELSVISAVEVLAEKLGMLLLSLGVMHFLNMYLIYRIRRRGQLTVLPPPVASQMTVGVRR